MLAALQFNTPDIEGYASIASEINQRYCKQHGYKYIRAGHKECMMHPSCEKVFMMKRHLSQYEWIMWVDSDACFINHKLDLEWLINTNCNLVTGGHEYGFDIAGRKIRVTLNNIDAGLNAGVLLLRNCQWSQWFLDTWIMLCTLGSDLGNAFHEQGVLQWMLIKNICSLQSNVSLVNPASRINRQDFTDTDKPDICEFILHLWGSEPAYREQVFASIRDGEMPEQLDQPILMPTFFVPIA